jgi:hypothetical protein
MIGGGAASSVSSGQSMCLRLMILAIRLIPAACPFLMS